MDKKSPASVEEAAKKKKEDYEARWDLIYMFTAVIGTVGVITFVMVSSISSLLASANMSSSSLLTFVVLALTSPTINSKSKLVSFWAGTLNRRRSHKYTSSLATASYERGLL